MIPVNSSAIRAIDHDGRTLFVQFHTSDTIYCHLGAPYSVFVELMQAESKGRYYNQHIRGRYR
jgi:hypothetical protein